MSYLQLSALVLSIVILQCCCPVISYVVPCKTLSDYTYKLPQNELAGKWTLSASSHEKSDSSNGINYIWIDIQFTKGQARVQVVTEFNGNIKTDTKKMKIRKEKGIYTFQTKDKEQSINIYPMTKDEILVTWSGFLHSVSKGCVLLFSRNTGISNTILDEFKDLSRCMKHDLLNLNNNAGRYAEICDAYSLKPIKPLDAIKKSGRWEMVAYAEKNQMEEDEEETVSSVIELICEGNTIIISEKQKNCDAKQSKVTISEGSMEFTRDSDVYTFYETCSECLFVAVRKLQEGVNKRILYLYTQTGMATIEDLEKFKLQATCEGLTEVHDKTGYGEYPDNCEGYESLLGKVKLNEFLGLRSLIFYAYRYIDYALFEPNITSALVDYELQGNKLEGFFVEYSLGSVQRNNTTIFAKEENGMFVWRDADLEVPLMAQSVGEDCMVFTFDMPLVNQSVPTMSVFCGSNPVTDSDIHLYLRHAVCENYPYVVLRNDPTREVLSCYNFPDVAEDLEAEKILGRWNYAIAASNAPRNKPSEGGWISFESVSGKVKYTDSIGLHKGTQVQLNKGEMRLAGCDREHLGTFYKIAGDSLLLNTKEGNAASFILFTKSGSAPADQIEQFKHLASCLKLPVIYTRN